MKRACALATTCCVLCLALPASAQERPAERDAAASPSASNAFLISGAVVFGVSWAAAYAAFLRDSIEQAQCMNGSQGWAVLACDHDTTRMLWVPMAGPWVTLVSGQHAGGRWTGGQTALLVADGVAEDVGLGLLAYGLMRKLTQDEEAPRKEPVPSVEVRPGAGTARAGLTAVVSF